MCHPYIILLYTSGVKNIVRSLTKKKDRILFFCCLFVCLGLFWGGRESVWVWFYFLIILAYSLMVSR